MICTHFAVVFLFFVSVAAQHEGQECIMNETGEKGQCELLDNCDYAKNLSRSGQRPQHCGVRGLFLIVCCPLPINRIQGQKSGEGKFDDSTAAQPNQLPTHQAVPTNRIPGKKSEEECIRYYPKYVSTIKHYAVFSGELSLAKEFPHMAILGYGDRNNVQWLCGGSLINEQFVLTAAHCVMPKKIGPVRWVRLGDLDIRSTTDDASPQDFIVETAFVHPAYRSFSHYHDIALLKLNREAKFDSYVKPACLHSGTDMFQPLIATGWGKTDFFGEPSSHLLKVNLDRVPFERCAPRYSNIPKSRLSSGILDEFQICAGSPEGKDTCPGDSGGPLQFKDFSFSKEYHNMSSITYYVDQDLHYYIVGVTSFGKACGFSDMASAGVYTRVSRYIDWIEDTVWPED